MKNIFTFLFLGISLFTFNSYAAEPVHCYDMGLTQDCLQDVPSLYCKAGKLKISATAKKCPFEDKECLGPKVPASTDVVVTDWTQHNGMVRVTIPKATQAPKNWIQGWISPDRIQIADSSAIEGQLITSPTQPLPEPIALSTLGSSLFQSNDTVLLHRQPSFQSDTINTGPYSPILEYGVCTFVNEVQGDWQLVTPLEGDLNRGYGLSGWIKKQTP